MTFLKLIYIQLLLLLSVSPSLSFKLNALFSDNMVLQSGRATIYGTGVPSEAISVLRTLASGASDHFPGVVDGTGFFLIALPDPKNGESLTGLTLAISNTTTTYTISNVSIGIAILCSGQSNMFLPVISTFDGNATMAGSWPNIRLFAVTTGWASSEQDDFPPPYNTTTEVGSCGPYQRYNAQRCLTWQAATSPTIIGGFSAVCFYTAISLAKQLPPDTIFGLLHAAYVGTDMQTWSPPEALAKCIIPPPNLLTGGPTPIPTNNSVLWNAMIHPIVRFGLRGVLWNQGEANLGWSETDFGCLFQALIQSWRDRWQQAEFFWGFVQLGTQPVSSWPSYLDDCRLGQSDALPGRSHTNRTGMAVAYDVGDHTSVHARNKTIIGQRLAIALLHAEWGMDLPALNWSPPTLSSATLGANGDVTLTFMTEDGRGIFQNDTHDCWECCALGRDNFQVYNITRGQIHSYVNMTTRLGPSVGGIVNTIIATPLLSGTYTGMTFARGLWPQCGIFAQGNLLPIEPFRVNLTTAYVQV